MALLDVPLARAKSSGAEELQQQQGTAGQPQQQTPRLQVQSTPKPAQSGSQRSRLGCPSASRGLVPVLESWHPGRSKTNLEAQRRAKAPGSDLLIPPVPRDARGADPTALQPGMPKQPGQALPYLRWGRGKM